MFTPLQAIEAISARISGEWDNAQLLKIGYLETDTLTDIKRIVHSIDLTLEKLKSSYHILIIKDKLATNHRPAKVQIVSEHRKERVTISYSNEPGAPNGMLNTAEKYLKERGFEIVGYGSGKHEIRNHYDYIISTTFNISLK